MTGTAGQLSVMIPSLDLTVTTTGLFGDRYPDPSVILGATPGDMQHGLFRRLMRAVADEHRPDEGPYPGNPIDFDVHPVNYADPGVALTESLPEPALHRCAVRRGVPFKGVVQNLEPVLEPASRHR